MYCSVVSCRGLLSINGGEGDSLMCMSLIMIMEMIWNSRPEFEVVVGWGKRHGRAPTPRAPTPYCTTTEQASLKEERNGQRHRRRLCHWWKDGSRVVSKHGRYEEIWFECRMSSACQNKSFVCVVLSRLTFLTTFVTAFAQSINHELL